MSIQENWIPNIGEKFLAPNEITGSLELLECTRRTNPKAPLLWAGDRSFPLEKCHKLEFGMAVILYQQALEYAANLGELADTLQKRS